MMYSPRMFEEIIGVGNDKKKTDIQKVLKTISRNGVSSVLFSLSKGSMRFSQLMFETRLNPNILNRHLKSLVQLNIVKKMDDKGEYALTETGRKLLTILNDLLNLFP